MQEPTPTTMNTVTQPVLPGRLTHWSVSNGSKFGTVSSSVLTVYFPLLTTVVEYSVAFTTLPISYVQG